MPRPNTQVLFMAFAISIALHLFLQHRISQCRRGADRNFFAGWFSVSWPYAFAVGFIKYGLPQMLLWLGFGPLGILPHSIAAWTQSVYGISSLFSLLQSIGQTRCSVTSFTQVVQSWSAITRSKPIHTASG